jgi:hypothetical protein
MATFMIILLIIGILIIGYISTGYAPNRVLKTEVGHIYYWGIGKRILGSIRIQNKKSGKKVPWWLSNIPFPIGFQRIFVPLKWTEAVPASRMSEKIPGTNEDKFKNPRPLGPSAQIMFTDRNELVPSLKIYEKVDYDIPIRSMDGYKFNYVFTIFFEIIDDMGPIGRPDFKLVGQVDLQTNVAPWAYGKNINEIMSTNTDDIKTCSTFEGGVQIMEFLDQKVGPLGCKTHSIALKIISGQDAEAYFDKRQVAEQTIQDIENQKAFEALQVEQRITKLNDAENDAAVAATEFKAYTEPIENFLGKIYEGEKGIKEARKYVLAEANTETETIGAIATKEMFKVMAAATGKNVGKERREEEQANAA